LDTVLDGGPGYRRGRADLGVETLAKTCKCKLLLPLANKIRKAIPPFSKLLWCLLNSVRLPSATQCEENVRRTNVSATCIMNSRFCLLTWAYLTWSRVRQIDDDTNQSLSPSLICGRAIQRWSVAWSSVG